MNVHTVHKLAIGGFMSRPLPPRGPVGRPEAPVDEATAGGRMRALRKGARKGQEEAADDLGITRSMLSRYETGGHTIPDHVVERAAQVYAVTPAFIRYGDTTSRMAMVRGRVGAGAQIEAIEQPPWRYVEVPASWTDALALEVSGLSCYPIYDDGDDIVIRGERRLHEDEILGRMCVVETADGLGLVKRVRRGTTAGLFNLESPNAPTIEDVPLQSARPVRMHLQR